MMCAENGATVLVVHHFKKAAEGVRKRDLIRGGNALTSASRVTYTVWKGSDNSLVVECLKFSRAARRPRFTVRPSITTIDENDAVWRSARLEYASVGEATIDAAESFILDALDRGARMSTTDLKNAAKASKRSGKKISGEDVSRALKSLQSRRAIDFEEGAKNAKLWGLTRLPDQSRQARQSETPFAGQTKRLPVSQRNPPACLPAPLGASSQVGVVHFRQAEKSTRGHGNNSGGNSGHGDPRLGSRAPGTQKIRPETNSVSEVDGQIERSRGGDSVQNSGAARRRSALQLMPGSACFLGETPVETPVT
jgi:hypothetical protein